MLLSLRKLVVGVVAAGAVAAGVGAGSAGAVDSPLCAYPISTTNSGVTVTAQFSVIDDPSCIPTGLPSQISLVGISYATGTATIVSSATGTFSGPGTYSLSIQLPCGVATEADLIYGPPSLFPPAPYDINTVPFTIPCSGPGTATIGYWKNHASAWPVSSVQVGGSTLTQAQALAILNTPPRGDATIILAQQLIAAELNVAAGNDSGCISATIAAANALLTTYPVGSRLGTSTAAGQTATGLATTLDQYNNGLLCAPHRA